MRILSLFDGCSCAQVAINKLNITDYTYYASEIDKWAISITQKNFPNTFQLGDISKIDGTTIRDIDLLIGGSPCQSLSCAAGTRQTGIDSGKSQLFHEYVRVLNEVKPRYFLLENVASMKPSDRDKISEIMGVEPVKINSALVSAQMRKRLYWANFPITQPEDKGIILSDILQDGYTNDLKSHCIIANFARMTLREYNEKHLGQYVSTIRLGEIGNGGQGERIYSADGKSVTLSSNGGGLGAKTGLYLVDGNVRKLTPIECERLQTLPDDYTYGVSNFQRYKMIGNGFTCDVISHILRGIL